MQGADVVVYDDLGGSSESILSLLPPTAEAIYVGKRGGKEDSFRQEDIDALLVQLLQKGRAVIRLKGGCPSTFSRITSELRAVEAVAGSRVEIVPGVSSALSAPLFAGFPLTDRDLGRSYAVASAHDTDILDWGALSRVRACLGVCGRSPQAFLQSDTSLSFFSPDGHPGPVDGGQELGDYHQLA